MSQGLAGFNNMSVNHKIRRVNAVVKEVIALKLQ